jgi:hypothetical protein
VARLVPENNLQLLLGKCSATQAMAASTGCPRRAQ